ncbi:MAG: two-component regulator propeller domain-containing protein [Sphingobacterium hotanense]
MRKILNMLCMAWLFCQIGFTLTANAQFLSLKFDHITSENGLPHNTIHGIAKDKYGFMWFGTWSGLCRYDGYQIKIYRYDAQNPNTIANNRIHNILRDSKGDLWVATFEDQTLSKYNYQTDDFTRVPYEKGPKEILGKINRRDHRYNVKFQFQQTQWHLDNNKTALVETYLPTGAQKLYTEDPSNPWAINDAYISDVYLDDQHVLWLGSYSHGINRAYLDATPFHALMYHPGSKQSLAENTIRSLTEDSQGNLWVGTRSKGITVVKKNGDFLQYKSESNNPNSIQNNYIKKLFCDSKGIIWIGNQGGLDRYDPRTDQIERLYHPSVKSNPVYGIMEDQDQNIWFATWKGVVKWTRKNQSFRYYKFDEFLAEPHFWTILQDQQGRIWLASEGNGIFIVKENAQGKLQILKHLRHEEKKTNTLSDNRIYALFQDKQNDIWIGTGNGLDLYHAKNERIETLSRISNLWPSGTIAGVTQDKQGYIWVSHKQGISRIEKEKMQIRTFSDTDGLLSTDNIEGSIFNSKSANRLYFGSNLGVCHFSPDSVRTNPEAPKIVFTELNILNEAVEVQKKINDRVVLERPIHLTERIKLTHADKTFRVAFAALHFTNPNGNKYAYMLEGFDADWIYTSSNKREASYSNLPPGNYKLLVKASNSDGVWTAKASTLQIDVLPPWWASPLAYLFYFAIGLLLLYIFYYYSTRYTKLKSKLAYEAIIYEKELEMQENKLQFFTNISHEIKTPLTLILSPIEQLKTWAEHDKKPTEQLEMMENNGRRLLRTVNQLLDFRRLETGQEKITVEHTDINKLISNVIDSFKLEARKKDINLIYQPSRSTLIMQLDADKLEKIVINLISNALKFTPAKGIVKVRLKEDANHLEIDVLNNGPSIAENELESIFEPFKQGKDKIAGGTGLGLTYSRYLTSLLGGQISVESRSHSERQPLTAFKIRLPKPLTDDMFEERTKDFKESTESQILPTTKTIEPSNTVLSRKCSMLIVEDNIEMNDYLADYFRNSYAVSQAYDGEEGFAVAQKVMPDLIISDVMMPKVDGLNFTQQIKSNTLLRHIPVLLLTARSLQEQEIEGLAIGADDYIIKPFQLPILALKVKNQLILRLRQQELFQQRISIEPSQVSTQSPDEMLLQKVFAFIESNMSNSDLKIDHIGESIGLSRAQLYRKIKSLTGMGLADVIKELRLKRAQQLLKEQKWMVSEVGYQVGFSDPEYFRKTFKAKFGYSPSEYAKSHS